MTATVISTLSYKFKDDDTYLNQENWQDFFGENLPSGYFEHPCSSNSGNTELTIADIHAVIKGLWVEIDGTTDSGTGNYLYFIARDLIENNVKLYKFSGITTAQIANIQYYISSDMDGLDEYLDGICWASADQGNHDSYLPIAADYYGKYFDLSKLIKKSGEFFCYEITANNTGATPNLDNPACGQISMLGLAQIYGNHRYNITIASTFPNNYYYLYPVPACSMEPSSIRVKNNSGKQITLKIRKSYNGMTFDCIHDAVWTDNGNYLDYALPIGGDIVITMEQQSSNPASVRFTYLVTQNLKNDDPGEGYTKAEANAIFMTKSEGELKADATRSSYQLYVDGANGDDNNDGSSGNPVKTIAKAVALANITNATRVTINIAAGTYAEDISITRQPTMVAFNATGGTVSVQYISIQYAEVILTGEFSASNRCTMMTAKLIINGNLTVAGDISLGMGSTFICGGNLTINNPGGEGISVGGGSFAFVFSQYPTAAVINAKNALVADNGIICYSTITGTYTTLETTSRGGRIFTGSQS